MFGKKKQNRPCLQILIGGHVHWIHATEEAFRRALNHAAKEDHLVRVNLWNGDGSLLFLPSAVQCIYGKYMSEEDVLNAP